MQGDNVVLVKGARKVHLRTGYVTAPEGSQS